MKISVVTLFPDAVEAAAGMGVTGSALARGDAELAVINPRDDCTDVHRTVDDRPFGGGPGMVMKAAPLASAIARARAQMPVGVKTVLLSPQGRRFDQSLAREVAAGDGVILIAGRYEGVDERLMNEEIDEEWSIGDFVLSGGELAALVVIDAVVRLVPGVLGHPDSAQEDSFSDGLLDHPHYTRPEEFDGRKVPAELVSGDHGLIAKWRLKQALGRTFERRPELLEARGLTDNERALLDEYRQESGLEKSAPSTITNDRTGKSHGE
ncbi:MAG: tRNA (guanosine(37)-N1)-methyltransferase TrmD [Gammaproteobacteria bacterium]